MRPLSARNPRVQRLTRLVKRREERAEQRALVVEGPTLVTAALDAGVDVRELYVDAAAVERPAVRDLVHRLPVETVVWTLPPGVLDRIGDVATSQGVLAVAGQPEVAWPTPASAPFVMVLVGLQMPGNVGTLIRAAAGAGAGAVVVAGGVDPTSPKVVRASAGALFAVPVVDAPPDGLVGRLQSAGYRVAASVVDGGTAYDRADLTGSLAVLVGTEAHGLDPAVAEAADLAVTIPTSDAIESLNVAMAGTVLAFEVQRQRRPS